VKIKVLSVYIVKTVLQLCSFVMQGDTYVQDETILFWLKFNFR